jgi:hypothetical protein
MEIDLYDIRASFQQDVLGTEGINCNFKLCKVLTWKMGGKFSSSWTYCFEAGKFFTWGYI